MPLLYYDRWPVAKSISKIIESSPIEWSTRIGLFGKWGEGKTSVLNFLEQQQIQAGNVVIKYSPWGVSNELELWKDFGKVLKQGLEDNNLSISLFEKTVLWVKSNGQTTQKTIKGAGTLAEATGLLPGAKVGTEFISNLIMSRLGIKRNDIETLAKKLGTKRLIVFIDDLDRTDPSVIPKLLLVLRELLDFKQFVFVLAFDREIISSALNTYNLSWDGESFLEKVIDFQVTLPSPVQIQINKLALHQFESLCPFVPASVINDVASLLPSNPRKLKLLARSISSMKDEVARHGHDELDWNVILILELFKIENDHVVQRLLYMSTEYGKFSWLKWGEPEAERLRKEAIENNELINSIPGLEKSRERIEQLIKGWRERSTIGNTAALSYQAMFALTPHSITWGEFNQFFSDWRTTRSLQKIRDFIKNRASDSSIQSATIQEELAVTILEHHAILLERASNVGSTEDHKQLILEACDALDCFDKSFCGTKPCITLSPEKLQLGWDKPYATALHWAHWVRNDGEPKLRAVELEILIKLSITINNPIATYDRIISVIKDYAQFGENQKEKKLALTQSIRNSCELQALSAAYEFIKLPGKIASLRSDSENQGARFILTAPESIAYSETQISNTKAAWESRKDTNRATDDALTFLELLLIASEHGDQYGTKDARAAFYKTHSEFIVTVWNLCTSHQRQFRMLSDMRKIRNAFIAQGIEETKLTLPDWLSVE